ncbi:helix-turn-helix domain-containing protein [Beggiatoa alba]|nr:helix-turn-helix domain-containing protein [Beggiatoa alba]
MLDIKACKRARLSRDARFDGKFFVGVKTTRIYCRPTCPASPKEKNVEYFSFAYHAVISGYRPCLRCHPDSSPDVTTAKEHKDMIYSQAVRMINEGVLENDSLTEIADRLNISTRYLRMVFNEKIGVPPKTYALFAQCILAKKLLHQTSLPVTEIAFASGFRSIRRFNDCFKKYIKISPSNIRNSKRKNENHESIHLKLYYRPPYNWKEMQAYFMKHAVDGLEWFSENSYGRTFNIHEVKGEFTAIYVDNRNYFDVYVNTYNSHNLKNIVFNIKRILDLDTDIDAINQCIFTELPDETISKLGIRRNIRLPGAWGFFEAGIRAIFDLHTGKENSTRLLNEFVHALNKNSDQDRAYFPNATQVYTSNLNVISLPRNLKSLIVEFAKQNVNQTPNVILKSLYESKITHRDVINYAKIYGLGDPDVNLLNTKNIVPINSAIKKHKIPVKDCSPFRSYICHQLLCNP